VSITVTLLVRLQSIVGKRVAEVMRAATSASIRTDLENRGMFCFLTLVLLTPLFRCATGRAVIGLVRGLAVAAPPAGP
jgi:hypothetical protein